MSKRLLETRNFVFWASYNLDRFSAMCMGMQPLMDQRMIRAPRHSCLDVAYNTPESVKLTTSCGTSADAKPVAGGSAEKPTAPNANISLWDPRTLGMSDIVIQAGWEATRDLNRMSESLFDGIYSFNVPKRTPQEDLELVTRNNLTIQRFLDELPTWLRSTGAIRRKESGLVYLHLFTHLTSIIASRPFLSPRPLPEDTICIDATMDPSQPSHSSHIIRRYRTLAFRVARASALQITSLARHIPLSSPCVTLPYVIYSACTILLLAPDDQAAMDGVRTGISVLGSMDESGYWATSAKNGKDRILALAKRWGVDLSSSKRTFGLISNEGAGSSPSRPGAGEPSASGPGTGRSSTRGLSASEGSREGARDASTNAASSSPSATGGTRPSTAGRQSSSQATTEPLSGTTYSQLTNDLNLSFSKTQEYTGESGQTHVNQWSSQRFNKVGVDQTSVGPPSYDDVVTFQAYEHPTRAQCYGPQESTQYSGTSALASGMAQPSSCQAEAHFHQPPGHTPQHVQQPPHPCQQQPIQHIHYHFYAYPNQHQSQYAAPRDLYQPPQRLPHVAFGSSHADPQHDLQIPHTHWHQVLPPTDPNLPFPPDPMACTDIAACFADTVRTGQDPTFVQTMMDPYASVAADWFLDAQNSFAVVTPEMYGEASVGPSMHLGPSVPDAGVSDMYAQATQMGGDQYGGYGGGYGIPGV
ncbi:hypothetical protein FRC08_004658 [Ceratobasidium sp. 394]|nr:hypothetical protein FRC08_004658 [Ceratobasidium sp. 394]